MISSREIRQLFLDFFVEKAHTSVKPSPVVPQNDPTILFTNAGMNQFKDVFLGTGKRDYTRAVNSQVCIRVSGKHNDLEEVGMDTYHHTLFEMLGNWSFGDYYKKEAILWAWELMTERFKLPKDKLYATIFESDDESGDLWKSITDIQPDHVMKFGKKDNFWEMAETGPCGPCSEIHIDRGEGTCDRQHDPGHVCQVNAGCSRFIELWNLVFIQYDRQADGALVELPAKHVDTGMGFERIVSCLQHKSSNYDTDVFQPLIQTIAQLTGHPYVEATGMPHRVLADHIRTLTFAIADNVIPSNEGRGYVLRRILRRAMRYAKQLGVTGPFVYQLVAPVVESMNDYFDYLPKRQSFIESLIKAEEESFLATLDTGISLFDQLVSALKEKGETRISGADACKLYDTYGFPIDLTQVMARELGMSVDLEEFQRELEARRELSRQGSKTHTDTDSGPKPTGGEARFVETTADIRAMAQHHTATHLLQAALRTVLGDHVFQAGSLVDLDRLRFDFSHFKALSAEELAEITDLVMDKIHSSIPVEKVEMSQDEAKALGAMALFGEKYNDIVRTVKIGDFSFELCGGHHLDNTREIEEFRIITETAISAGTRRIEAICGTENVRTYDNQLKNQAIEWLAARTDTIRQLLNDLESASSPDETAMTTKTALRMWLNTDFNLLSLAALDTTKTQVLELIKTAEKLVNRLKNAQATSQVGHILDRIENLTPEVRIVSAFMPGFDMTMLRELSDTLVSSYQNLVMLLGGEADGKGSILVRVGSQVNKNTWKAPDIIKTITAITGGGGGGRPDMAQAGCPNPGSIAEALDSVKTQLKQVQV